MVLSRALTPLPPLSGGASGEASVVGNLNRHPLAWITERRGFTAPDRVTACTGWPLEDRAGRQHLAIAMARFFDATSIPAIADATLGIRFARVETGDDPSFKESSWWISRVLTTGEENWRTVFSTAIAGHEQDRIAWADQLEFQVRRLLNRPDENE